MTTSAEHLVRAARVVGKALHLIEDGEVHRAVRGLAKLRAELLVWSVDAEINEDDEPVQDPDDLEGVAPATMDEIEAVTVSELVQASEGVSMTHDEFVQALRELVDEAEEARLELPPLIAALREQADALQDVVEE